MSYSLNLISLPEEADSLIKLAERDKRILEHRKESLLLRTVNSAEDVQKQAADLTEVQAKIASADAIIAGLPEGKRKQEEITKRMALEVRLRRINESGSESGPVALIEQEYDAGLLDRQIAAIDEFIAAVTARKAEL